MATRKMEKIEKTTSSNSMTTNALIDRLFLRLSAIYGHIWQSQFKNEGFLRLAKKEWADTLPALDEQTIERVLTECKRKHSMPPTLPGFYQLCCVFQNKKSAIETESLQQKIRFGEQACAHWQKLIVVAYEKRQGLIVSKLENILKTETEKLQLLRDSLEQSDKA